MTDPVIEMSGVWKIFGSAEKVGLADAKAGASKAEILVRHNCVVGIADASISVRQGEIFCIMGLSGSGKSTLLRHVNRLIEPTAGEIRVLGQDVLALSPKALRELRAERIGMVFQHMALLPHRSVEDNVAYPLELRGTPKATQWRIADESWHWLDCRVTRTVCQRNCRVGCNSASGWHARLPLIRPSF